jgi:hypothetical protein
MPPEEEILEALRILRGYSEVKLNSSLPADIVPALLMLLIANVGSSSSGGDASAANQLTQIARLTEIRDKIIASPATEAKQDTQITCLTEIRDKIIASPATEAKQDTQITCLTEIRDKLISAPATSANQTIHNTRLTEIRDRTIPSYLITPDDHTNNQAVVKTSAGAVYAISCFNASSSLAFFQIHDKATAPVNGDIPIKSIPVFPNGATVFSSNIFGAGGLPCSIGIAWAFSSTRSTLTLAVGSDKTSWVGWL